MVKLLITIIILHSVLHLTGIFVYVVNSGSETLSRIDLENEIVDNNFVSLGSIPNRIALGNDFALIVNSGDNNIQKIDLSTGNTLAYIYIGQSTNPYDIIIEGEYAYVSASLNNSIYKLHISQETIVDEVEVGNNPAGMAIWQGKLYVGNTDYASNYQNCSVSVIDLTTFAVENTFPTQPNPQFLTVFNDLIHICCTGNWDQIQGKIQIYDPIANQVRIPKRLRSHNHN